MNLISVSNERLQRLMDDFPDLSFDLFTAGGDEFISCVVCWVETSLQLEQKWNAVQNILALSYKSERKVARWNLYIAFFCKEEVGKPLRLLIQNDKFSARKMVFDSWSSETSWLDDKAALKILNYEIFEVDLSAAQSYGVMIDYAPSELVSRLKFYSKGTADSKLEIIKELVAEFGGDENQKS